MNNHSDPRNALYHYYCEYDALAVMRRFQVADQTPEPGVLKNFMGVRVPTKVYPPILDKMGGTVEELPNPGNWHADIAEWGAALLSVVRAKENYRIVELGCGWGCWLVNMGAAARTLGLQLDLIGIEGDQNHLANACDVLMLNGFSEADFRLYHGVAAPKPGKAVFPNPAAGTAAWGGEAVFYPDRRALKMAKNDPTKQILDCHTLPELSGDKDINLVHVDIQGAELGFVTGNIAALNSHVHRILIGTHSRIIEGQLMATFEEAGWLLEMERPAIAPPHAGKSVLRIDGVQLWRNPKWP